MVLKRTGSVARGGVALGQDRDLDGLDGAAVARRAGVGAVARPAEPPELGGVDAVPDGVAGRQVRGQPDPQGLDGAGPAGGAGGAAVADGGLPADVGDVGLDGQGICVSVNLFFTSFAKQACRSRKGGFTGCANVFSPIPVTA